MTDKEIYAKYTEWQIPFKELFSHYYGKAESDVLGRLIFSNNNILTNHHGEQKKVGCEVRIGFTFAIPHRYSVMAEEQTLEIIGGVSSGNMTEEEALSMAEKMMKRYCFKHKEREQLSLL